MCNKLLICLVLALAGCMSLALTRPGRAAEAYDPELAGRMEAEVDGNTVNFPSLKTNVRIDIQGDLANVSVEQTFANPLNVPMHATYLFPLNKDAAVHAMTMEVGDEIVRARIKTTEEADEEFQRAREEGHSAALLKQYRPNMFTQDVANLMPGHPITVRIEYVQPLQKVDGEYEAVVPLVVGPRYLPADHETSAGILLEESQAAHAEGDMELADQTQTAPTAGTVSGQWELDELPEYPDVANVTIPDTTDFDRVSIQVSLDGGMPVSGFHSPTHELDIEKQEDQRIEAKLAAGKTIDNCDFVLRYSLEGERVQAGLLAHKDERGGMFSMLLEPPNLPKEEDITPRELVFVLDTSGSMSGRPMDACKAFMRNALDTLRGNDSFRIVRFGSSASQFAEKPMSPNSLNLLRAKGYVEMLQAGGGTEMASGINCALDPAVPQGAIRVVVFLTDGYIGNEHEVLRLLEKKLGQSRLYAFGVGTAVNRYLLSEMAHIGRGFMRVLDPTEDHEKAALELAKKIEAPVLTDIRVDWGTLQVSEVTPMPIPDLFAGQSIRIQGKYVNAGTHRVTVSGKSNGRNAKLALDVTFPDENSGTKSKAIPLIWARSRISDYMRAFNSPPQHRDPGVSADKFKDRVIDLGLKYGLTTQWTSFVAVSEKRYNPQGEAQHANVQLPMVKGVEVSAYPQSVPAGGSAHAAAPGGATPEPATLLGMLLLSIMGGLGALWKRIRGSA